MAISPNSFSNVIDCDIHPTVPSLDALLPYMNEHWKDTIVQRGVHELETISYPKNAPLTVRGLATGKRGACLKCRLN